MHCLLASTRRDSAVSPLPITPFHYPVAKLLHQLNGKVSLSLPALIVGAMTPDLEVPFMVLFTGMDRMVLHSLIGGLTFGTAVAVALTVLLYPHVAGAVFPIDKEKVRQKCAFSGVVVFSCFLGVLSHVLLDVANHAYNPVFWPFLGLYQTPSPIVSLLGGAAMASLVVHGLMAALFVGLFVNRRDDFWNQLLVG
jgi:membrane-bound metal-dependent hydrolase YbcI (DUF457 family)